MTGSLGGTYSLARSQSDISNSAIRIFLQKVGEYYDEARGFEKFRPTRLQRLELVDWFARECCYCAAEVSAENFTQDHLIPMNKDSLGLHSWGNVVPSCRTCNRDKHKKDWRFFLESKCDGEVLVARRRRIEAFIEEKQYEPDLHISDYATNLYSDVGEVAMTLIKLRYEQAQEAIRALLAGKGSA